MHILQVSCTIRATQFSAVSIVAYNADVDSLWIQDCILLTDRDVDLWSKFVDYRRCEILCLVHAVAWLHCWHTGCAAGLWCMRRHDHDLFSYIAVYRLCSLSHTSDTDKTRRSCLVLSCWHPWCEHNGVNWIGDKSRLSATENFEIVLSSLEMQCELSLVLSQFPIRNVVTCCEVVFGNWVKTSSQMCSHRRQDWTKLFSLQYIEDYWKLSATVANSFHTADAD